MIGDASVCNVYIDHELRRQTYQLRGAELRQDVNHQGAFAVAIWLKCAAVHLSAQPFISVCSRSSAVRPLVPFGIEPTGL